MTTDRQAALAAAALVVSSAAVEAYGTLSMKDADRYTRTMADSFLRWLEGGSMRPGRPAPADSDERLKPNIDFNAPTQATTHTLDSDQVQLLAAERLRLAKGDHFLSAVLRTPSGKYACVCGNAWPCLQKWSSPVSTVREVDVAQRAIEPD